MALQFLTHQACEIAKPTPNMNRASKYLGAAVEHSRLAVVRFLVSTKHFDGRDILHSPEARHAILKSTPETRSFLLNTGRYRKHTIVYHETLGQFFYRCGSLECLEAIFLQATTEPEEGDQDWILATKLLKASRDGDLRTVETIISQQGAPINPFSDGPTPLHLAISRRHREVVDALLDTNKARVERTVWSESARERSRLMADSAIKESVVQRNTALFYRILDHSKTDALYELDEFVKIHGNSEMLAALNTKIESS